MLLTIALTIPMMIGLKWVLTPVVALLAGIFGLWLIPIVFGACVVLFAVGIYVQWTKGLLWYQRRRTIQLHTEMGYGSPVWPAEIQATLNEKAAAAAFKREMKEKWGAPGPRIPPIAAPSAQSAPGPVQQLPRQTDKGPNSSLPPPAA